MRVTIYVSADAYNERKELEEVHMEKAADAKAERILSIYSRLKQGKFVYKAEESLKYDVAQRTIQRDLSDIQCFLNNQNNEAGEIQEIVFDRKAGGYRLETKRQNHLNEKELLAICKVLLDSRSLVKEEMFPIINKLISLGGEESTQKLLKDYVQNEMHHYVELQHHEKLLEKIWTLEDAVKTQKYIRIRYKRLKNQECVVRKVKPVGVMFSEFYFYLTAYIEDIDKKTHFQNPDDEYPTIYRIDRLQSIEVLEDHFSVPYAERFEEGEFRKRVQFMYGGRLRRVKLKCKKESIEAVLDRLPMAEIVREEAEYYVVRAEVFGNGIDRWLNSQEDSVKEVEKER